ncbi:hypothetical protein FK530_18950 [Tsukamurella conjunctivitidis]|uniref:Uncharacterized protein n=1 Tax=Tsukamurella conjunctivitidis TaxID=2592068 RepID=A0A5C5RZI9_9ACTN|nr:hypothetical protein [Tsukamurella conjunctivitidis]TWS27401.1 hypothetical protein FK530_18950 [Tsukamurella conjunctivitidis]
MRNFRTSFGLGHAIGLWIISHNLHRRHLQPKQRAAIAAEYLEVFAAEAKKRQIAAQNNEAAKAVMANLPEQVRGGTASDEAGDMFGVSGRSVRDAHFVMKNNPEAFEKIKNGEVAPSAAAKAERAKSAPPKPEPTIEERAKKAAERIYREVALGRRSR